MVRVHMDYGLKLALTVFHKRHRHNDVQQQTTCIKMSNTKQQ